MERRQLEYFVKIARAGSFRRASEELHVAQPALSRQIQSLEEELGVQLFERGGRGIVLTEAGELLLERANFIIREFEQARADVTAKASVPSGQVSFGAPPSIAELLFAKLAVEYRARYPSVKLRFLEGIGHLWGWLAAGEVDLAILPNSEGGLSSQFSLKTLVREPVYLVGAPGDSTMRGTSCRPIDVLSRPLILTGHPNTSRKALERLAAQESRGLNIVVETGSLAVQLALVAKGVGYAVLPHSAVHQFVRCGPLSTVRIEGLTIARTLARLADRPVTAAVREFSRMIEEEVNRLKAEGVFGEWTVERGGNDRAVGGSHKGVFGKSKSASARDIRSKRANQFTRDDLRRAEP